MTKVCPNCNKINADSSQFCENCGEELSEVAKTPSGGGTGGWWSKQGSGAKAAIIIAGICVIGLIVIVGLAGMFSSDKTTSSSSLQTFSGSGISFQYPEDWSQDSKTGDEVVSLATSKGDSSSLAVYVEDSNGKDLDYWKGVQTDALTSAETVISKGPIQIAGVTGYRLDDKYTDYGGGEQVDIIFVKNDVYYDLLFTTHSISAIENDIQTIVDSFKTT